MEHLTLFFHIYRVVFLIVLVVNIIGLTANGIPDDKESGSLGLSIILAWTLFVMSWHY